MNNKLKPQDVEWLRNAIRQASVKWPGRAECLRRARKKVLVGRTKKGKATYKFHWQCAKCLRWERNEKLMEVDHINEIGPFCGDWNIHLFKHFPEQDGLQALCVVCHMKKTNAFNSARTKWKRKGQDF